MFPCSKNFLHHVADQDGIHPDLQKVNAIVTVLQPNCLTAVRLCVGLCTHYRKFIPEFYKNNSSIE